MGLETIVGIAALIMAAIAGAFGIGHSRGTSKAEAKADQQRTEERATATEAVAERRVETTKEPGMYSKLLIIFLMTMLTVSCAKTLPAKPELTDTACDWVDIIYLTEHDIAVLDKQTKRDILVHNKSVQANCAKKIN